jgi:hypothetical protein
MLLSLKQHATGTKENVNMRRLTRYAILYFYIYKLYGQKLVFELYFGQAIFAVGERP